MALFGCWTTASLALVRGLDEVFTLEFGPLHAGPKTERLDDGCTSCVRSATETIDEWRSEAFE
ncbi:hypothetical protein ENSA7_70420 [Enhygromyxa salina]|uniref:Uncharacterized protein n=1 Tax=Enhygromyxa salina TaxID=215803 RepID=A0A2S9XTM6_9BACT|nr:hypothetical protein ENSA7_70420 [Enhygromyxa salina]